MPLKQLCDNNSFKNLLNANINHCEIPSIIFTEESKKKEKKMIRSKREMFKKNKEMKPLAPVYDSKWIIRSPFFPLPPGIGIPYPLKGTLAPGLISGYSFVCTNKVLPSNKGILIFAPF